jgi:MFS family permease
MRVFHGAMSSATDPLAYSLVADYYPADKRGTPNAILSSGNFIGIALSCMSILFIKNFGWRATYWIMGATGVTVAMLGSLVFTGFKKREIEVPTIEEAFEVNEKTQKKGFGHFIE